MKTLHLQLAPYSSEEDIHVISYDLETDNIIAVMEIFPYETARMVVIKNCPDELEYEISKYVFEKYENHEKASYIRELAEFIQLKMKGQ